MIFCNTLKEKKKVNELTQGLSWLLKLLIFFIFFSIIFMSKFK
jgi:hypothetical protein